MNELGNERRGDYRKTYPKHVECSKCGDLRLKEFMQSDYKLMLPLCKKCLNDAPGALVDFINRMNTYITDLEKNRDNCRIMANSAVASLVDFATAYKRHDCVDVIEEMILTLNVENKTAKSIHRP